MIKNKNLILLYITLYLFSYIFSSCLQATTVNNLYKSTVQLKTNQLANNHDILSEGMLQVLIKVSGVSKVEQNPVIASALKTPDKYLFKYTQSVVEKFDSESRSVRKQRVSSQVFLSNKINKLLKDAGFTVWGKQRPMTLSWIMIEFDPQNRLVINDSDMSEINYVYKEILNNAANNRGLPVTLPLQDLEEQMTISPAVIWSQFPNELQQASARYGVDVIFSSSIQKIDNNQWNTKWLIIKEVNQEKKIISYNSSAESLNEAINQGINWLADNLVKGYTMPQDDNISEQLELKISGIKNINDYVKLEKYLKNISVIENINLKSLGPVDVSFLVNAKYGVKSFKNTIGMDNKLVLQKSNLSNSKPSTNDLAMKSTESTEPIDNNYTKALQLRWR